MFSSPKIGLILLISHYLAVLISGMGMRFYKVKPVPQSLPVGKKTENILYESMYSSVLSVLVVGGFVAVFYVFSFLLFDYRLLFPLLKLLESTGMPPTYAAAFARGLIEMTGGCGALSQNADPLSLALCAFLIAFGGLSVLIQQICYLQKAKVKIPVFLAAKSVQSVLAFALCYALAALLL